MRRRDARESAAQDEDARPAGRSVHAHDREASGSALRASKHGEVNEASPNTNSPFAPVPETPVEGAYLAPPAQRRRGWGGAGATVVGIGVILAKAKGLLLILLNLKFLFVGKLLLSSLSFFVSVWFYALLWGWSFAFVFVLLILVHELGHAAFMRAFGVPASMPYFIPGFGALITMKGRPASALEEAYIALGGPLIGSIAACAAYLYGVASGQPFWIAAGYTGFFLNLFNLFPVYPLDGGRIVGAISPRVWIVGLAALIGVSLALHWFNPLLILLVVLGIPHAIAAFRGTLDARYYALTLSQRAGIAVAYFGLAGVLFVGMLASHVPVGATPFH
jgi:Zn-dependent protease